MLYQVLSFDRRTGIGEAIEASLVGPSFNSGYIINIFSNIPLTPGVVASVKSTNHWFDPQNGSEPVYIRGEVDEKQPCLIYQ